MTAPNVDLLRRTMDAVLAHPELHNQGFWAIRRDCGTVMCFAGWVCALEGLSMNVEDLDADRVTSSLDNGEQIDTTAASLLGVDWRSAMELFHADNSTADLKHYVDEIAEHGMIRAAQDPWTQE
jgi:hypothetical protein